MVAADEKSGLDNLVRCRQCGAKNRLRPSADGVPRCGKCKALLPWLVHASESSFADETRAPVPVVVDFWAPWCAPCRMIEPVLERLSDSYTGRLKVVKVNVDEQPALAQRWQAMSIPLLVVLRDAREVDRIVGALPPIELERRLLPFIDSRGAGEQSQTSPGGA
jgi:thioredoxin 2